MKAEQILKRIGYDNDSITTTEKWIAETVYKLAIEDAAALRQPLVIGSACAYCKGTGKIFHWEFGQFVKCGVCQADR